MATPSLDYQNFYSSTLSSTITAADTTIYLDTLPTPTEGYLVIEPDSSSNREIVWYTSKGANFVTVPSSGGRGVGGTTAVAHSSGATVNMNNVAEMWTAIKDGSANTGMHQWFDESFADYVKSGATIAIASGLIASISSGVVYINGRRLTLNAASKTFTASKDTYVDVVALSGTNTATLSYTEVNSGVSGSAPVSNGMHIGMVQSHTASLTRLVQTGNDVLGNSLKQENASAVGTWKSWTPTLTNITLGNGTLSCKFTVIGKTVHVRFAFTMGSSSAMGTAPSFTLPVVSTVPNATNMYLGVARLGSVTGTSAGWILHGSSTVASFVTSDANSTFVRETAITSTNPFTWATGDYIAGAFTYEAA